MIAFTPGIASAALVSMLRDARVRHRTQESFVKSIPSARKSSA
jgi:hypothetical protein